MIYAFEHHDRLLQLWREQDQHDIRLAHVDFHDDLRGLLIDRRRRCAYAIRDLAAGAELDGGNFLAHAVLEGRVAAVRWVHDLPGGRAWDTGIVRYESDLMAWPDRRRHRRLGTAETELDFEELLVRDWDGPRAGELLSIDWDCFASILFDPGTIGERVARFVDRLATTPEETYVAYSPEYCHPTLGGFRDLVSMLGTRFEQTVRWLSPGLEQGETTPRSIDPRPGRSALERCILRLRRWGIY